MLGLGESNPRRGKAKIGTLVGHQRGKWLLTHVVKLVCRVVEPGVVVFRADSREVLETGGRWCAFHVGVFGFES
jgi:hypothetical protein